MSTLIGPLGPIDTIDYGHWTFLTTPGPFKWGDNRYVSLGVQNSDSVVRIWKSSDDGVTWNNFDSSTPAYRTFTRQGSLPNRIALASVASPAGSASWILEEFDMETDTFIPVATVSAPLTWLGTPALLQWMDYSPVTDEWRLYYTLTLPSRLLMKRYSGGDLGDVTLASAASGSFLPECSMSDPLGNTLLVYEYVTALVKLFYIRIDTSGVAGATTQIASSSAFQMASYPAVVNGKVVIPFRRYVSADNAYFTSVIVGDDYTNPTPAFTTLDVSVNQANYPVTASDGSLWWIAYREPPPSWTGLDQLEMCTFDGTTLGPIVVVHDELSDQSFPVIDPSFQFLHDLAPIVYDPTDGSYEWVLALEYIAPGVPRVKCTSFFWRLEAPVTPEDQLVPRECFYLRVQNPADDNQVVLNWKRWLGAGDAISSVTWTATVGVTVATTLHNAYKASATFSIPAAVSGEVYYLTCQVTSQLGKIELRTVQIDIREAAGGTGTALGWWRA